MNHVRPSWSEYFMRIAHQVASRATCLKRRVGAVIVRDKQILTTGYNGVPKGIIHCEKRRCLRAEIPSGQRLDLCRGLHAEMNALLQAAVHGVSVKGGELYCTNQPCLLCAKMIINAGVKTIFIANGYPGKLGAELLKEAKIPVIKLEINANCQ